MVFRRRRPVNRSRRVANRKGVGFSRRPMRKRPVMRGGKRGPTTSKERRLMADRTFTNLEFVTLTAGQNLESMSLPLPQQSYGMLGVSNTYTTSAPLYQQFVFAENYGTGSVPGATSGIDVYTLRMLPGNSLRQIFNGVAGVPLAFYSDSFEQTAPTGTHEWAQFYNKYLCHGSSVEVTLVDSLVPGQLVVLPVVSGYDSDTFLPQMRDLCNFRSLPDDQPYARIKLVSSAGGVDKVKIKHKMLTKKLFDKKILRDDYLSFGNLQDSNNVSPYAPDEPGVNQWSWFIAFIPVTPIPYVTSSPSKVCSIQVKINYFTEMTDRTNPRYTTEQTVLL